MIRKGLGKTEGKGEVKDDGDMEAYEISSQRLIGHLPVIFHFVSPFGSSLIFISAPQHLGEVGLHLFNIVL